MVFETNKAQLQPRSASALDNAVSTLKRYPELIIEVAGHTDNVGDDANSLSLSTRRAENRRVVLRILEK